MPGWRDVGPSVWRRCVDQPGRRHQGPHIATGGQWPALLAASGRALSRRRVAGCSTCCHPFIALPADEVNAVVLDIGTYQVKAGYAGEDAPKYVFPSVRCQHACCLPLPSSLLPLSLAGCCRLELHITAACRHSTPAERELILSPLACAGCPQSVGAVGGDPDGMDVDGGAARKLYVGTHALSQRRDNMEVGAAADLAARLRCLFCVVMGSRAANNSCDLVHAGWRLERLPCLRCCLASAAAAACPAAGRVSLPGWHPK